MPRLINDPVYDLIRKGFMYIAGRDKKFRPVLVFNGWMINRLDPRPTPEDVISV